MLFIRLILPKNNFLIYPVRNNAPLLPPGQRPSGPAAAAGLDFRIIPAGFNAPLEFLTGFTLKTLSPKYMNEPNDLNDLNVPND